MYKLIEKYFTNSIKETYEFIIDEIKNKYLSVYLKIFLVGIILLFPLLIIVGFFKFLYNLIIYKSTKFYSMIDDERIKFPFYFTIKNNKYKLKMKYVNYIFHYGEIYKNLQIELFKINKNNKYLIIRKNYEDHIYGNYISIDMLNSLFKEIFNINSFQKIIEVNKRNNKISKLLKNERN